MLLVCGVLLGAVLFSARAEGQVVRPNVLLVVTDDQRATNTMWAMPKTLSTFAGGTKYTNAFATTPLCCPSRATILTGRYAHNTGVKRQSSRPLDPTTLFPRLLQGAGYRTGMAGKFMNGWPFETPPPYFDRWAKLCVGCGRDPFVFDVDGTPTARFGYSNGIIGGYARQFLRAFERNDSAPWFLYVTPTDPHRPWTPTPRYANTDFPEWYGNPAVLEKNRADKPPFVRQGRRYGLGGARRVRTGQLRELKAVDDMVGRLAAQLTNLNERSRTLLIFTSDNGFLWAEHGIGSGRTAGQKRLPYTASVQVPLLVRRPSGPRPNTVHRLVGNVDIAPTVLEAAGIRPDPRKPPLDGRSLFDSQRRGRLLLEYWGRDSGIPSWGSIRTRKYQYVEYYADDEVTTTFREYYDLVDDPWQLENLFRDGDPTNSPDVSKIRARLARDRVCVGTEPPFACP